MSSAAAPCVVTASAPGKCILFGEHAVVYGQPAVAVAVEQRVRVSLRPAKAWTIDGQPLAEGRHPHLQAIVKRLWPPRRPGCTITVTSELPSAAGLGSSAALGVAMSAAIRASIGRLQHADGSWAEGFGDPDAAPSTVFDDDGDDLEDGGASDVVHLTGADALDPIELSLLGHMAEAHAQGGLASPMDTAASAHGGAVVLSDVLEAGCDWQGTRRLPHPAGERRWEVHTADLPEMVRAAWLVLGHTGEHASTATLVQGVAARLKEQPELHEVIEAIGDLTRQGLTSLRRGDLAAVGRAMDEDHHLLQRLGVSSDGLDRLVRAAAPHSLGAKLTGAGGGGCMVALTLDPRRVSEMIELAGGTPYVSRLGAPGAMLDA